MSMRSLRMCLALFSFALFSASTIGVAQQQKKTLACSKNVYAAIEPLPELIYQCPTNITDDSDEAILKRPNRFKALQRVMTELGSFTASEWWSSPPSELTACSVRGQTGALTPEQQEQISGPEYQAPLLGNSQIRLVVLPDPCYQTSYNGANAFLLHRSSSKVYVTQVLDGYYSRLGKSIFLHLSGSAANPTIRIETANISGMRPQFTNHYFVIDKKTKKAVPRKIVRARP